MSADSLGEGAVAERSANPRPPGLGVAMGDGGGRRAAVDVLRPRGPGGHRLSSRPARSWSFGRDERCTETLLLPTLSRVGADHPQRRARAVSGQLAAERHGAGAHRLRRRSGAPRRRPRVRPGAPVRGQLHGQGGAPTDRAAADTWRSGRPARSDAAAPSTAVSPLAAAERTGVPWTPEDPGPDAPPWITVAALAVARPPVSGAGRAGTAAASRCADSAACGAATPASTG